MTEQDNQLLQKIESKIEILAQLISNHENFKMSKPCFDIQLFKQQKTQVNYSVYLHEIETNYQKLASFINKKQNTIYIDQINYLTETIINQINALQREIATLSLRKAEKFDKPKKTLFDQYNKNLDYLRRLETMKYELKQTNQFDMDTKQKITVLGQRIYRCKQAISSLEQKIEANDKRH